MCNEIKQLEDRFEDLIGLLSLQHDIKVDIDIKIDISLVKMNTLMAEIEYLKFKEKRFFDFLNTSCWRYKC